MKIYFYLILVVLISSCKKDEELQPEQLKKVVMIKVDYRLNKFLGGKEFSFFVDNSTSDSLNIIRSYTVNDTIGTLTLKYGDNKDTIFSGTEITNGQGKVIYPSSFDNSIFYFKLQGTTVTKPSNDRFQVLYHDLPEAIQYDSVWKAVSNLEIVSNYVSKNPSSKIGLFLFRPSVVEVNPGDWKWFLIFRE